MMKNRTRPVRIEFRVTEQERQVYCEKPGGFLHTAATISAAG